MSGPLLAHQIASSCDVINAGLHYLDQAIRDKGFIQDGSYADIRLANAAKQLRLTAELVERRRAQLLANEPVRFLDAAE